MGNGQPVTQARFEDFLQELTDKFGGVTSFVRAPGPGPLEQRRGCGAGQYRGDRGHDSSPGVVSDRVALG